MANDTHELVDDFFTIRTSDHAQDYLVTGPSRILIEYVDDELAEGELFKITNEFEVTDDVVKVKVIRNSGAEISDNDYGKVAMRFRTLIGEQQNPAFLIESLYNIRQNDLISLEDLMSFHADYLEARHNRTPAQEEYLEFIKAKKKKLAAANKPTKKEIKNLKKQRKALLKELDKADGQLKELVQQNKRKEVADLLDKYLPREEFSAFENRYWDQILDAIRNPLPIEKRVVLYRGFDKTNNILHKTEYKGVNAVVPFAVMLDKNQGSYNRRLRSIETMMDKVITQSSVLTSSNDTKAHRISMIMHNHKSVPVGSPYLSFSSRFETAQAFSNSYLGVYAIDPRIMVPSITSGFSENEWLTPLVTFPDEYIVGRYAVEGNYNVPGTEEQFWEKAKINLKKMHPGMTDAKIEKLRSNKPSNFGSDEFQRKYLTVFAKLFDEEAPMASGSGCYDVFKSLVFGLQGAM
jgi:flagellar motility protein MotE (MotC chaperone)